MKAGKIWGQTELIHANGVLEFHRIEYKSGFKCSEHEHQFKWNGFFVESGKMLVRVWQDGVQDGYDIKLLKTITDLLRIPVIASGGAGKVEHFLEAVKDGGASALLAASVFHFNEISISEVKEFLNKSNVPMRMT